MADGAKRCIDRYRKVILFGVLSIWAAFGMNAEVHSISGIVPVSRKEH